MKSLVTLDAKFGIVSTSKFGEIFSFITEELFNTIINSEELIYYCRNNNYNFPTTLDYYLEDLDKFMDISVLREINCKDNFTIVRDSNLDSCIVPSCFVVKL